MTIVTILFLIFLEGMLSFDNAIVLAVLASSLPKEQQKKALLYGMWGAIGFRGVALFFLTTVMKSIWIKFAGAAYLFYLSGKYFLGSDDSGEGSSKTYPGFWQTIVAIELMDIAFSLDSILASVGVSHDYWVVLTGGIFGILTMRIAASLFIHLIKIFPGLVTTAYMLITWIAIKLATEAYGVPWEDPAFRRLFWVGMGLSILYGFVPRKQELKAQI